jgi:hypothetical protein
MTPTSPPGRGLSFVLALALCLPALGLYGCAMDSELGGAFDDDDEELRGQTILFVGTDPQTLETNLYLAQAVTDAPIGIGSPQEPEVADATDFDVYSVTDLVIGGSNALQSDSDTLFSDEVPFPVPSLAGDRVAILGTTRDGYGDPLGGRIQLLDPATTESQLGDEIPGLYAVQFTWSGGWLVLEARYEDDPTRTRVLVQPPELLSSTAPVVVGPEGDGFSVEFAGLKHGSDEFVVLSQDAGTGTSEVLLIDPTSGEATSLSADIDARLDDPVLSDDGRWLAFTRSGSAPGSRAILVRDLHAPEEPPILLTDDLTDDCHWPVWTGEAKEEPPKLAFVCSDRVNERPDVLLWTEDHGLEPEVLTAGPQPNIFEGTMDGLVIRSAPLWDPRGEFIVFGVSAQEELLEGVGLTLLVLPLGDSAFSVWSGDEGSGGWAHFSSATMNRNLLLWDREQSGLEDSTGSHPMRIVFTDGPGQDPRPVELGRDLLVAYPLLLGWNTMLYP